MQTSAVATDRQGTPGARFVEVRGLTEQLAQPLSAEDQTAQSMPDVSPTKWHRAHVTWFFEEFILSAYAPRYERFRAGYDYLFNSYYEGVGPRHSRAARGVVTRPGIDEIAEYRRHVDAAMTELLERDTSQEVAELLDLGLRHEQQHQELLLMDIKHVLSCNVLDPAYCTSAAAPERSSESADGAFLAVPPRWCEHSGGLVEVGSPVVADVFDNETPRHSVHLQPFALAARPVNCGEVLEFIADGGYARAELWLSDGWAKVQTDGWTAPLYWREDEPGEWSQFTLGGRRPIDPDEPVCHVSYYEADAIARWSADRYPGARLPTEFEWEATAAGRPPVGAFLDPTVLHPRPAAESAGGPENMQLYGDVWEWTSSAYLPYPGFVPAPGAVGEYNGKFMVGQHVLRGGACVTPAGHARATYRNFFPPGARWQFGGVRLARDLEDR